MLAGAEWDVALLQECPPRFAAPLAEACGAEAHRVLTSRNSLGALRTFVARLNPDLIASGEGGSNLTLVRSPFRCALCGHERIKRTGTAGSSSGGSWRSTRAGRSGGRWRLPASRSADADLCIANLHATNDRPDARHGRRAARGRGGDRVGRRRAAALRRRPQPAAGRGPGCLRGAARALRPRPAPPARARSTTCSRAASRSSSRRAPWPPERRELPRDGLRAAPLRPRSGPGALRNG